MFRLPPPSYSCCTMYLKMGGFLRRCQSQKKKNAKYNSHLHYTGAQPLNECQKRSDLSISVNLTEHDG